MPWKYKTPYYRHKGTLVTCVFGYITPLYQLQFGHFLLNLSTELYLWLVYYVYLLTQYCAGDKIEKIEMSWACGAYG